MRPQYNHDMVTSVTLWLANKLEDTGQAYFNTTGLLYLQTDPTINGNIYSSPYRGWIYDSCVQGATIPTGFYNASGQFLTRASGVVIDFNNGRIITPQNWGPTLSGAYARKEVNVYFSNVEETEYILEQAYGENPNLSYVLTGMAGNTLVAPMVMLTNSQGRNMPFALGGTDNTKSTIRAFCISNSNYLQEGIGSLCRDAAHSIIPIGSYTDAPLTASGDLKSGNPWSYCNDFYAKYGCANGCWIENVYEIKTNERANGNLTYYLQTIEFDISRIRNTHQ